MIINIQFDEATDLLWEMLKAIPEDQQENFAKRVNLVACKLTHPCLDSDISVAITLDNAR